MQILVARDKRVQYIERDNEKIVYLFGKGQWQDKNEVLIEKI